MSDRDRPRYRLTIVSTPSDTPPVIRLRRLLKGLLRAWGFRAEKVEQLQGPPASATIAGETPAQGDQQPEG